MSSVWTSQYPDRHHATVSFSARLPKDRLTLAELLSARGVHTAGFVANAVAGTGLRLRPRLRGVPRGVPRARQPRATSFRRVLPAGSRAQQGPALLRRTCTSASRTSPTTRSRRSTRASARTGPSPRRSRRDQAWITDVNQGRRALSADEREHLVRLYDGNLAFADQEVGALRAGAGGRGPLGPHRPHRGRRPRRGALRARLDRPQRRSSTRRASTSR